MKKQTLKISTVSLLCVLCAGLNTNAMAAASVRTLGGTGTVNGTASAGAATRSTPRAGSLRVMPSSSKSVSSASADKAASSSKPTSATQRLSIGKYLGGATTTATTGSSSAGSAGGDNGNLQTRIEQLEDSLGGRISVLEDKDYMTEEEVEAAIAAAQLEGADVDLTAYETASEAEAKYQPKGNYLTEHQSLADYETAAQAAEKYQPKGDYLTEHQSLADYAKSDDVAEAIAQAKLDGQVDLSAYAKSADLATVATTGSYNDLSNKPEIPSIEGLVTTSAMNTALSGKQDSISDLATIRSGAAAGATAVQPATLNDYAKIIAMNAALEGKQDTISDLATIRSGAAAGATAVQPATLDNYATTASLADYATTSAMNTALADYATTASLDNYATTADLEDYATTASLADYATTSAMQEAIAQAKLDGSDVDLSAYAKSADLATVATTGSYNDLSNKPEIPSIEGLVTTSEMNTVLSGKQDSISDLATIRSGAAAGATAVQPATLNDYAKTADLAGYATTAALADYATTASLDDYAKTADLADYATTADLEDYATTEQLADYATTSAMNTALADYATTASLDDYAKTADLADYATTADVTEALADKQDTISDLATIRSGAAAGATAVQPATLNNYATTASLADYMTEDEVAAAIAQAKLDGSDVDLSAYETAVQAAAKYQPKGNYLTEHQSLEGYATTAAMNTALADYATTADLSAYAKSADLATVATTGSYNDLSNKPEIPSIEGLVTTSEMDTALAGKQDSISDLATIRSGAAAGATAVQPAALNDYAKTADLAGYATTASLADYATTSAMDTALAGKQDTIANLAAIEAGAAAGATAVQPSVLDNYATTAAMNTALAGYATTASLADYATTSEMDTALAGKQDSISDLATIRSGAAAGATAVQPAALNDYAKTADLAGYATTASLNDYAKTADLAGYATTASLDDYAKTADLADYATTADLSAYAKSADLATVATTGSYNDLSNKPEIPSIEGLVTTSAMNTALAGKQDSVSDLATIRSGAAAGATAVQPATLNDYVAKPTLPSSEGDYMLMLNYDNGTYTYSWNGVAGGTGGGSGSGSGGGSDSGGFSWDDSGW